MAAAAGGESGGYGFQRFLSSGDTPVFLVGEPHTVTIHHRGDTMTVSANGTELTTFTDTERPYLQGGLGLYTEDARVAFKDFRIAELPRTIAAIRLARSIDRLPLTPDP